MRPLLGVFVTLRLVSTGRNGANYGRVNPPQLLIYDQQDRPSFAYRWRRHVEQRKLPDQPQFHAVNALNGIRNAQF